MSSKEFVLFSQDKISYKHKFYILMDLLITNQNSSRSEALFFMLIFYTQMISGFFSEFLGVFDIKNSTSDKILNYIEKIFRIRDLFVNKYSHFKTILVIALIILLFFSIHFIITCYKITRNSFYTYSEMILNFYIKFMIYIGSNIMFDLAFCNFCFEDKNPFFKGVSCTVKDNYFPAVISVIMFIMASFFTVIIQFFYCDAMYLSTSFYSRIACNYELYTSLNTIVYSFLLTQVTSLSKEVFLFYNIGMSIIQFNFFINHYPFYDKITNNYAGLFHILYLWTSIFFFIFAYIDYQEKGIIYLVSSVIILYFYFNLKYKIEEKVFLDTPYYKINNRFYLLFYIKNLIDKMNHLEENPEDKALFSGIMQMHILECPNKKCITKTKQRLYLPITGEWSDRSKLFIEDRVFMINFIITISTYFISANKYSPDLIINLSLYYLEIIGNYCLAMFYCKKAKEMHMTLQEQFSYERLRLRISRLLNEKLKPPNEPCPNLDELDPTMYFKYEDISQNLVDEINNDINLSLEFWKNFRRSQLDYRKQIDFNKIFSLTDKIRTTKENIEILWKKLIEIYNGVNELFDLYFDYVEQINDDDLKKRDLEGLKRKSENFSEHIGQNFYSILFNRETGIIIANADKGKEGLIEKTNLEIESIFKYKPEELKGMNLTSLMPKIFSKIHRSFIEKYYQIGERKIIEQKEIKTYGKNKDNAIIVIRLAIKLFPILNDSVYFVGLITKENIDDVIFLDHNFNIQGMSPKLLKILNCDNKILFRDNDIPFYVICKKFVNFYKIFLQGKKQNLKEKKNQSSAIIESLNETSSINSENKETKAKTKEDKIENIIHNENIEINENIELEYEIRLPQFLLDYSDSTNKRLLRLAEQNKAIAAGTMTVEAAAEANEDEDNGNDSNDEFGESDLLVDDNDRINVQEGSTSKIDSNVKKDASKFSHFSASGFSVRNNNNNNSSIRRNSNFNSTNANSNVNEHINNGKDFKINVIETPTPTPEGITPTPGNNNLLNVNNENDTNYNGDSSKINQANSKLDFNKKSDEEKAFIEKVKRYKELFTHGNFDQLDELIDDCNRDSNSKEYKFNFTFDKYKFGIKNMSYVVRCIDAKNEGSKSDDETVNEIDPKLTRYKKEKANAIKPLFEVLYKEKEKIIEQQSRIPFLKEENPEFEKLLSSFKNDMIKMSMVHGKKEKEELMDENASQMSHSSFNADLVKKNRIEEIRANLLNNISDFFTLKYIKITVLAIGIISLIYGIIYIILFLNIYDNLKDINELNINLFQTTIWMNNLIGTLISLKSLYSDIMEKGNYYFNSYISDNLVYFEEMKNFAFRWYENITDKFGDIEDNISKFISDKKQKELFWDNQKVTYTYKNIYDVECFPMAISQSLSNINSVLKNDYFSLTISNENLTKKSIQYIDYITFMAIENTYDNLLPNQYDKLRTIPHILKDFNSDSSRILIIFLIVYACLMVFLCIGYAVLLHLTNKNMSEGMEKVTKIKLTQIEDTVKKIEGFNVILKKYRERESKNNGGGGDDKKIEEQGGEGTTVNPTTINPNQPSQNIGSSGFNIDAKKYIPLKILNMSYFQTGILFCALAGFLIPVFILTAEMVNSTNKIINIEEFIYGKILNSSSSIVKVKCSMSNCDITNNLNFTDLINIYDIQDIVQALSIYGELDVFYNRKFLLDACAVVFMNDDDNYNNCIKEELIQSANNTESILKLIEETIDNIYKEQSIKTNTNVILKDGREEPFKNYYLYESESFNILEKVFYKYVIEVSDNFSILCMDNLLEYLNQKRNLIISLVCILSCTVICLCIYIGFCFISKLIYYLSVSRCIMKIIPTTVINNTPELETFIENKY